jgi:hypothetical protein
MPISADFTIDFTNRRIAHSSGSTRYTAQAMYSYLADLFDDATSMDDTVPMSAQTPNEFSLINGWFIDDESYAYLYEGSVKTVGLDAATYTNGVYRLTMQSGGYVSAVAGDIGKTVTDGTRSGVLLAYNNTTREWYVRRGTGTAWAGSCTITTGTGAGTITGSVLTGEDVWANFYNLAGGLKAGGIIYVEQNQLLVTYSGWGYTSGDLDALVRVTKCGTAINSRKVAFFSRDLGDRYGYFEATASANGGRNPLSVETEDDLNDDASGASVTGVVINYTASGYTADIDNDGSNESYDWDVDGGGNTVLNVYRRLKYLTRVANSTALDNPENMTEGRFYLRALGAYPIVKASPFGTMPGSVFFGARGVLIRNVSDPNSISLIDASGATKNPPVSLTVTVTGVASGDRVLVGRSTAGVINKSQFTLNGVHASATTVTVNEAIPSSAVPSAGVIRIGDVRHTYSGVVRASKQFTGVSPGLSGSGGDAIWNPLIDDAAGGASIASGSLTYSADFEVTARVRKYASGAGNSILPFENQATVTVAGASIGAIRTVDNVAT